MTPYSFFRELHSGFRYIVLILLLLAIIRAWADWLGKKPYSEGNRKLNLFTMISVHTQLLIGLVLYFLSPFVRFGSDTMKDHDTRYWTVEHLTAMIIAIVLITIGHSKSKKATSPEAKHKAIAIFYTVALVIVVATIMLSGRGLLAMTH
ncbi:cytochrome B [Mucilaginibacter ginsenosidivorans]|uniref:Cytochrome B n=1 Tax=Mucilaginibacter ginsenosidivorans TaxID=398053 RepID=A0A5B8UQJ0_9SPHI|nr:cytochrome B [Mucilaginibacter ginsenosidivorans]QEC61299.1 cytochrome B [Mucilaginibacter ginsenosidivorans]